MKELWRSISFRLTLNYGLLAVCTTLVLLSFVFLQVIHVLHTQASRHVGATAQRLVLEFERRGREGLIESIEIALSDHIDADREIYLLVDSSGTKLVGNLEHVSPVWPLWGELSEVQVVREGVTTVGRLRMHTLPDGATLVVGYDMQEMNELKLLIGQVGLAAIVVAVLLIAFGTYVFRTELQLRLSNIRDTAVQIRSGHLKQRIPVDNSNDEFSQLARDINSMMDRIQDLMLGVRHISDTIAHNLRTPLTRVLGYLRDAQRVGLSQEEVLATQQKAIREIESLNQLFAKLLQISEVEVGVRRQSFDEVDMNRICSDVIELYDAVIEEKNLTLDIDLGKSSWVSGDADLLASAVANLLDNAIKHARHHVTVSVQQTKAMTVRVSIADDGAGVPEAMYGQLGQHFMRLDEKMPGHGLGLTSVLAIVKLHGGTVSWEDNSPGLRVLLDLPLL